MERLAELQRAGALFHADVRLHVLCLLYNLLPELLASRGRRVSSSR